jgi:2'-hydroxyisoflavone reductase
METSRRRFIKSSLVAGGAMGLGLSPQDLSGTSRQPDGGHSLGARPSAPRSLNILILGGTNLTGPHNVRYALERGHSVSIFTRGRRKPGLFQDAFEHVEHLIGDRADNLEALKGRSWDAVIDASGMQVEWTTATAELLKESVRTYMYISSTGVFYPYLTTNITEDTDPELVDPSDGEDGAARYGVMKALSEIEARKAFGEERTCVVRPGYIVGPLDSTHRGTYWPDRITKGGEILVPGKKTDQVQQIDVRDLTEWMIHLLEDGTYGTYNATGPSSKLTMEEYIYGIRAATSSDVSWTWIEDHQFLEENQVYFAIPWILPTGPNLGSQTINIDRAKAVGLKFRPVALTAMETLEWYYSLPEDQQSSPPMAISAEKEAEVLAAWKARARPLSR